MSPSVAIPFWEHSVVWRRASGLAFVSILSDTALKIELCRCAFSILAIRWPNSHSQHIEGGLSVHLESQSSGGLFNKNRTLAIPCTLEVRIPKI